MSLLRIDRQHVSFNEGGHHFTFYLRWVPGRVGRRVFRAWIGMGARWRSVWIDCDGISFQRGTLLKRN
jgi:hypothetical protein